MARKKKAALRSGEPVQIDGRGTMTRTALPCMFEDGGPAPIVIAKPFENKAAIYLGDGLYRVGGVPLRLEGAQADVLQALVELEAGTLEQLTKRSGVDEPQKVLKTIRDNIPLLAQHILIPGGRGKGGYSTTIRRAP